LVSIIIPAYNRAHIVRQTVDSVLAQTYAHFEAIIVDDGSTDNTREVLASYTDPRVRYFYKHNGGLSSARNFGLSVANGEYIAFLDSDDVWHPWKLAAQVEIFRRHPSVGLVWTDMSSFTDDGTILEERHIRTYYSAYREVDITRQCQRGGKLADLIGNGAPDALAECPYYIGNIFDTMFLGNMVHPPTAIVRRARLQESGPFDPEVTGAGAEDYHFYFRVAEHGAVSFLDAPSTLYRVHPTQMSTLNGLREARGNLSVIQHWLVRHPPNLPASTVRQRLARAHAWVATEELSARNPRAATPHFWRSLRYQLGQPSAVALLALSLLPAGTLDQLRNLRRAARRMNHGPLVGILLYVASDPDMLDQALWCLRQLGSES